MKKQTWLQSCKKELNKFKKEGGMQEVKVAKYVLELCKVFDKQLHNENSKNEVAILFLALVSNNGKFLN